MDSLTEAEIRHITGEEMEAGVQRLSSHFSWPEFCDKRQILHQGFVYNVAMLAATCGLPGSDVIQAAAMAKALFPQLDGPDALSLLSTFKDALSQYFPNPGTAQRLDFIGLLTDLCVGHRALFQAVLSGATKESVIQLQMAVQSPPTPCPLAEGVDLKEWQSEEREAELRSLLHQKEEKLKQLRDQQRVSVEEIEIPEDGEPDRERLFLSLNSAVKSTKEQMLASLTQEVNLLTDILQLKLQKAEAATRGPQNTASPNKVNGGSQAKTSKAPKTKK